VNLNELLSVNDTTFNVSELLSKANFINTITELIHSYLKNSNVIGKMSSYQKNMIIDLHRLKMTIDDSNLLSILDNAIKDIETKRRKTPKLKSKRLDTSIKRIQTNINQIIQKIDDFLLKNKNPFLKCINFIFNDTFGSLSQLKCELMSSYNTTQVSIPLQTSSLIIDALLFSHSSSSSSHSIIQNQSSSSSTLMIVCCRGDYPYELFAFYDKWIENYLNYGIDVLLWNYRGYGESGGFPTMNNIKSDCERVLDFIKGEYHYNKIGVHGMGVIGGICGGHLLRQQKINFCFEDRCVCDLYKYIDSVYCRGFSYILKAFLINNVNISNDVLYESNSTKIISFDLTEDVINDSTSLKNGIAYSFYSTAIQIENNNKTFIENILNDTENEYAIFENDLTYIISKFTNAHNDINEDKELKQHTKYLNANTYSNLNSERDNTTEGVSNSTNALGLSVSSVSYNESKVLKTIKNSFDRFDACGITLTSLHDVNERLRKEWINNFFINMLVWGSYKIGNIYATDKLIAYRSIAKKFSDMNGKITKILENPAKYIIDDALLSSSLKSLLSAFVKIDAYFNDVIFDKENENEKEFSFDNASDNNSNINSNSNCSNDNTNTNDISLSSSLSQCINVNNYKTLQLSNLIKNSNVGNMLILNCGYEGKFTQTELEMFSIYLLNSNFLK
jgi:hypothetical protein